MIPNLEFLLGDISFEDEEDENDDIYTSRISISFKIRFRLILNQVETFPSLIPNLFHLLASQFHFLFYLILFLYCLISYWKS